MYENAPVILREAAWYVIAVHFVRRGMEFNHQLRKYNLDFEDDSDSQYIVLNQEIKQIKPPRGSKLNHIFERASRETSPRNADT
ncbi:hypothetical protein DPMN_088413 [Dreissena polymorpha]|uniref:Uncharacterized protein n=1 Tax=Dreissena polymorpha TaxID=45954 RepID=A0A9D4QX30_DREPO|nr:hypothetical protein DPMN_088413 [Dreissena polymorpha]